MVTMTTDAVRSIRSADEFKAEFKKIAAASIGLILIRTREPRRCAETLMEIAVEREVSFKLWACNAGWMDFPDPSNTLPGRDVELNIAKPSSVNQQTIDAHKALEHANRSNDEGIYVMQFLHHQYDKPLIQQDLKDFAQKAMTEDMQLVILAPESAKIPVDLEDDVHVLDFRLPSHAELLERYESIVGDIEDADAKPSFSKDDVNAIVQNAVGMTVVEFEASLAIAIIEAYNRVEAGDIEELTPEEYIRVILRHKTEAIKKTDMLELMSGGNMDEIGGYDLLKQWLRVRAKAYSEDARKYGVEVPRGMLCAGPPGSGKSSIAKAVSSVLRVPLIKFDIGKVFGKFVGESEGRVRAALKAIESMAPCVLPGTLIRLADGSEVPVEELYGRGPQNLAAIDPDSGERITTRMHTLLRKESKPALRITTASGKSISVTEDHKLLVLREGKRVWVQARDLVTGDDLVEA